MTRWFSGMRAQTVSITVQRSWMMPPYWGQAPNNPRNIFQTSWIYNNLENTTKLLHFILVTRKKVYSLLARFLPGNVTTALNGFGKGGKRERGGCSTCLQKGRFWIIPCQEIASRGAGGFERLSSAQWEATLPLLFQKNNEK